MNKNREDAFNQWWLFHAQPEGRMTPSNIWDAACDWMKDELRWRVDRAFEKESNVVRDE